MLHFVEGDMFDRAADIRVNTVNCVGVMGKGVALAFKSRYPAMFADYRRACREGRCCPGELHVFQIAPNYTIVNFPTKRDWRDASRYEDIDSGLKALQQYLRSLGPVHVTLPALGCGHGGLEWERVKRRIEVFLEDLEAEIWVYSPRDSRRAL